MKRTLARIGLLLLASAGIGYSQYYDGGLGFYGEEGGRFMGGFGFTSIREGGQTKNYVSVGLRPEFSFGKFGVGLNINLLYDVDTGAIRAKDWNTTYDYFRMLRYLRYGHKLDKTYARVGTLDAARLGHGFIVNYFTNEASYDNRKIGLEFDLDFGQFGFESTVSNLGRSELIGLRGYVRPLYGLKLPIIRNFAAGATYAADFDPDVSARSDDGISAMGFDFELPIIRTSVFTTMFYFDYAQLKGYSSVEGTSRNFGSGQALGIYSGVGNLLGVMEVAARLERRWLGKEFIASYFDPFYEIDRFKIVGGDTTHKADALLGITEESRGVFGELYGNVLGNKVRLLGMLSRLDAQPKSGRLHLAADAPDLIPVLAAHATYDKSSIETVQDVFTLNSQSVARLGLGYKIKPYLIAYIDYIWTYVETEEGSHIYRPQERIEPKLVFSYNF
ncbi:MAG TPA: hypothetical protein PLG50_08815 [bacterium]|nr:hypothetical protein [bacterium]HQG45746.1 hypothetical protein [bacterium]HQI48119.1 hypothetical protein [bacterium]HQJ64515.1 hypothetical protein [bacterium]